MSNGKPPVKFRSIVFDFDGTLAELCLDFGEMKQRLAALAQEFLESLPTASLPVLEWLEVLMTSVRASNGPVAEEFQQRSRALILDMELEAAREGSLFPFTRPILGELRNKGIKVAIITRNCEKAVRAVFPDMDDFCSGFLARDHVPRVKPDPDHLFRALSKAGATLEAALMVGDHPLDIQTGKRAGILTAGVYSGNASRAELIETGAHWTARNCEELFELLSIQGLI